MTRTEFFPYPMALGALTLEYELAGDHLEAEANRIFAVAVPESETVCVRLSVDVADGSLDKVLPETERPDPPVAVIVAVRSISSRERRAVVLEKDGTTWRGELALPKTHLYGQVDLEPTLVRTSSGSDDNFAAHPGALIASGAPVTIEIDESPTPIGGYLEIKFDNFRESANPKRSARAELLYILDTDRDTPILWLNEGIPEFKIVMLTKGPRGRNLRVRDAMFDTIVSQVWTALASIALTELALVIAEQKATEDQDSDPVASLPEWHGQVINFWATHLFHGSRAEAIERIIELASDKRRLPELYDALSYAVQTWAGTDRAFRGLLRLRDSEGV